MPAASPSDTTSRSLLAADECSTCQNHPVDWNELLSMVEQRLGMYVGRPRYDRAFSVITGFDLAHGRGELTEFQRWMVERHSGSSLVFWALILVETFGDQADESHLVTDEDHQLAIGNLCLRLREFLDLRKVTGQRTR